MNIPVWLGREWSILPGDRALVGYAAIGTAALESIVVLPATISPGVEQSDVASSTSGTRAESTNKVAGLQIVPGDRFSDLRETDGIVARSRSV